MGNDGHGKKRDMSYTQNRELSWLRFDERVLAESLDETVPLFERLKFIAIFESNMHEFLMVRMGGLSSLATLKRQPRDNKSGMTPSDQVGAVFSEHDPFRPGRGGVLRDSGALWQGGRLDARDRGAPACKGDRAYRPR